ncbi:MULTISPECIES: ATP-binding protein [Sphaerisporangium]|uniref:ATP-binding protein n=1 Tax=Sphaerisporangium rhizosphaerae TaxID=2269375 RepID=A0ABW2P6C8_9ACTN
MHSTDLTRGPNQWSAFDWWPPIGWWPHPARDLAPPEAGTSSATFVLPPRPESVHSARSFAAGSLIGWRMRDLVQDMELVVSELATNALRHGLMPGPCEPRHSVCEPIRMSMIRMGSLVGCVFADPGSAAPVMRDPSPLETGGMGLHIVESMSLRWGWNPLLPYGKVVWAVLKS